MKKPIYIFDLDGTTIDSSHRFTGTAEGKVNLAKWIEDSTRENIFKDSILPLAKFMKALMKAKANVWVCTARCMSDADLDFLAHHGIKPKTILSRKKTVDYFIQSTFSHNMSAYEHILLPKQ